MEFGEDPYEVDRNGHVHRVRRGPYRVEHFGFADGVSQPFAFLGPQVPFDPPPGGGTPAPNRTWAPLAAGEIRIGDSHPEHARPRLAYLPQRHAVDWDFPITVRGVVEQGRYAALRLFRRFGPGDDERVGRALAELDLTGVADRQIRRLSGGQQQRVFLARSLAQGADIFLLDEPFASLDLFAAEELTHVLRAWERQGRTVLVALHDLELARRVFSRGILLATTLVAAGSIGELLSEANVNRAFRTAHCVHGN